MLKDMKFKAKVGEFWIDCLNYRVEILDVNKTPNKCHYNCKKPNGSFCLRDNKDLIRKTK